MSRPFLRARPAVLAAAWAALLLAFPAGCAIPGLGALLLGSPAQGFSGPGTPAGTVVEPFAGTVYGHADGPGAQAKFTYPWGLALDSKGVLYVSSEAGDHAIRRIAPDGMVSTLAGDLDGFADGPGADARFRAPRGMAVDAAGNVYVADLGNHRIRRISPEGVVSTIAGGRQGFADGIGAAALFSAPEDVALAPDGALLVADTGNNVIRRIDLAASGSVTTFAGPAAGPAGAPTATGSASTATGSVSPGAAGLTDGPAATARFSRPRGLTFDGAGNLYVADFGNGAVRKVDPSGVVSTVAKVGGPFTFRLPGLVGNTYLGPQDLAVGKDGALYCAVGKRVSRVALPDGAVTTIAGIAEDFMQAESQEAIDRGAPGRGTEARFGNASAIQAAPDGTLFVTDALGHQVRRIRL